VALGKLTHNYGTTVLVCGAATPALLETAGFRGGLRGVRELVPPAHEHHRMWRRVERLGELDDEALAERVAAHDRALCIVNGRRHARELFERLTDTDCYHLSGAMCPRHRGQRVAEIRAALARGRCLVIATAVIEAGDLDVEVVYRAEAGLDDLARAALCNRAGRSSGRLRVFRAAGHPLQGEMARRARLARVLTRGDPLSPTAIAGYFQELYRVESTGADDGLDRFGILPRLEAGLPLMLFPFESIARDVASLAPDRLLIPFDDAARRIVDLIEKAQRPGALVHRLRPYAVEVPRGELTNLESAGVVRWLRAERLGRRLAVLSDLARYRDDVGLV
jgi:CRISPR-associated endonuclease/helicase Cas3